MAHRLAGFAATLAVLLLIASIFAAAVVAFVWQQWQGAMVIYLLIVFVLENTFLVTRRRGAVAVQSVRRTVGKR